MDEAVLVLINKLAEENTFLRNKVSELEKQLSVKNNNTEEIPVPKSKKTNKVIDPEIISEKEMKLSLVRSANGKRLAAWNKSVKEIRDGFLENAKLEW